MAGSSSSIALASLLALGIGGGAHASDLAVTAQGENFAVRYGAQVNNVVGGGPLAMAGNGESATYTHSSTLMPGPGFLAISGGESGKIIYRSPATAQPGSPMVAGATRR